MSSEPLLRGSGGLVKTASRRQNRALSRGFCLCRATLFFFFPFLVAPIFYSANVLTSPIAGEWVPAGRHKETHLPGAGSSDLHVSAGCGPTGESVQTSPARSCGERGCGGSHFRSFSFFFNKEPPGAPRSPPLHRALASLSAKQRGRKKKKKKSKSLLPSGSQQKMPRGVAGARAAEEPRGASAVRAEGAPGLAGPRLRPPAQEGPPVHRASRGGRVRGLPEAACGAREARPAARARPPRAPEAGPAPTTPRAAIRPPEPAGRRDGPRLPGAR